MPVVQPNAIPRGRCNVSGRNPLCRAVVDTPLFQVRSKEGSRAVRLSDLSKVRPGPQPAPTRGEARRKQTNRRRKLSLPVVSERLATPNRHASSSSVALAMGVSVQTPAFNGIATLRIARLRRAGECRNSREARGGGGSEAAVACINVMRRASPQDTEVV
jgi:hypothetical protein